MGGGEGILPNTGMYVPVPYNLVLKTSFIEESWAESFLLKILLRLNVVFTVRIQLGTVLPSGQIVWIHSCSKINSHLRNGQKRPW